MWDSIQPSQLSVLGELSPLQCNNRPTLGRSTDSGGFVSCRCGDRTSPTCIRSFSYGYANVYLFFDYVVQLFNLFLREEVVDDFVSVSARIVDSPTLVRVLVAECIAEIVDIPTLIIRVCIH